MTDLERTFAHLNDNGKYSVGCFWKAPNGTGTAMGRTGDLRTFLRWQESHKDWNAYVALNPARGRGKPSQSEIEGVRFFVLDFDKLYRYATFPWDHVHSAMSGLLGLDEDNFMVVYTGGGIHFWVPCFQGDLSVSECDAIIKGITRELKRRLYDELTPCGWKLDSACADVARVVRLPGSMNQQEGTRSHWGVAAYDAQCLVLPTMTYLAVPDVEKPVPLPDFSMWNLAPALQPVNLMFLMAGASKMSESRHKRLFALASNLHELGVGRQEAGHLLRLAASRCIPDLNATDPIAVSNVLNQKWGNDA